MSTPAHFTTVVPRPAKPPDSGFDSRVGLYQVVARQMDVGVL
jgi:hypothetical protein